jgi:outer membrane biosynthesis protein TonB
MRKGDDGGLDTRLEQRLRDELDSVQPRFSSPRYLSSQRRPVLLRLAPAVLAATLVAMLGLTAYAGSPNPVVWTERVVNIVHPTVATSPSPEQSPAQHTQNPQPSEKPEQRESPEPSENPGESPEPQESPEPSQSPEPSDGHSGDGSSGSGESGSGTSGSGTSGSGSSGDGSGDHSPEPSPSPESGA